MVELAVRDSSLMRLGSLPDGQCILTALADGGIRIDRADPRILVSAELLAAISVQPGTGATLTAPPDSPNGTPFWTGSVLKIDGVNRGVIYRIGEYVPGVRGYIAEWPD